MILRVFDLLRQKRWTELKVWTDKLDLLHSEGLRPFTERGFYDTAYDHMMSLAAGFLKMSPRSRGPYLSATEEDVAQFRAWLKEHLPEFLEV